MRNNGGAELFAPTLSREPERARRKGGAGFTLTTTFGWWSRASCALLPVAEQTTAVATSSPSWWKYRVYQAGRSRGKARGLFLRE